MDKIGRADGRRFGCKSDRVDGGWGGFTSVGRVRRVGQVRRLGISY